MGQTDQKRQPDCRLSFPRHRQAHAAALPGTASVFHLLRLRGTRAVHRERGRFIHPAQSLACPDADARKDQNRPHPQINGRSCEGRARETRAPPSSTPPIPPKLDARMPSVPRVLMTSGLSGPAIETARLLTIKLPRSHNHALPALCNETNGICGTQPLTCCGASVPHWGDNLPLAHRQVDQHQGLGAFLYPPLHRVKRNPEMRGAFELRRKREG